MWNHSVPDRALAHLGLQARDAAAGLLAWDTFGTFFSELFPKGAILLPEDGRPWMELKWNAVRSNIIIQQHTIVQNDRSYAMQTQNNWFMRDYSDYGLD